MFEFQIGATLPDFQVSSGDQQEFFALLGRPEVGGHCARLKPHYVATSGQPTEVEQAISAVVWFLQRLPESYNPVYERASPIWNAQLIGRTLYAWKYTQQFSNLPKTPEQFVNAIRDVATLGKVLTMGSPREGSPESGGLAWG